MASAEHNNIGQDLGLAKQLLDQGQVIGLPTETVYGLAGNALDPEAVARIFEVKQRPTFNPLIIHIGHQDDLTKYVTNLPIKAQILIDAFWPGPLTILLPKKPIVPDLVTAGSDLVAVRMPAHPMALALLHTLSYPLAAPSANPFMYVSPTSAEHVAEQLGRSIPYILDGGQATVGVESTIVGVDNNAVTIYRHGGITAEDIEALVGPVQYLTKSTVGKVTSPGQLSRHYATSKLTVLINAIPANWWQAHHVSSIGFIGLDKDLVSVLTDLGLDHSTLDAASKVPDSQQFLLSRSANLNEAAMHLFEAMRMLDQHPEVKRIILASFPPRGLGRAINDRLGRAINAA